MQNTVAILEGTGPSKPYLDRTGRSAEVAYTHRHRQKAPRKVCVRVVDVFGCETIVVSTVWA